MTFPLFVSLNQVISAPRRPFHGTKSRTCRVLCNSFVRMISRDNFVHRSVYREGKQFSFAHKLQLDCSANGGLAKRNPPFTKKRRRGTPEPVIGPRLARTRSADSPYTLHADCVRLPRSTVAALAISGTVIEQWLKESLRPYGGSRSTDRQMTLVASRFAEFALACFQLSRYFRRGPLSHSCQRK